MSGSRARPSEPIEAAELRTVRTLLKGTHAKLERAERERDALLRALVLATGALVGAGVDAALDRDALAELRREIDGFLEEGEG